MRATIRIECSDDYYSEVVAVLRALEDRVDNFDSTIRTDRSKTKLRLVKGRGYREAE
jgi:hypothetical protein